MASKLDDAVLISTSLRGGTENSSAASAGESSSSSSTSDHHHHPFDSENLSLVERITLYARHNPGVMKGIVIGLLFGIALLLLFQLLPIDKNLESAQKYMLDHHAVSLICMFCAMTIGPVIFFPVVILETFSSFVYGWEEGVPLALASVTVGNILAFAIGRNCFKAKAQEVLASFGQRVAIFERMIELHPWKMTLFLRLNFIPITLRNYICAALPIEYKVYIPCTFVGHFPYTVFHGILGTSVKHISDITSGKSPAAIAATAVGAFFLIIMLIMMRHFYSQVKTQMLELEQQVAAETDQALPPQHHHIKHESGPDSAIELVTIHGEDTSSSSSIDENLPVEMSSMPRNADTGYSQSSPTSATQREAQEAEEFDAQINGPIMSFVSLQ